MCDYPAAILRFPALRAFALNSAREMCDYPAAILRFPHPCDFALNSAREMGGYPAAILRFLTTLCAFAPLR